MTAGAKRRTRQRPSIESRHSAREAALQMLYQWEVGRLDIEDIKDSFWAQGTTNVSKVPDDLKDFAKDLAGGVAGRSGEIDPVISEAAEHWRLERMNVIDRLILRLAVYEFLNEAETPGKVIINEALELARTYSTDDAVRFINGILDAIRRRLERE
jgi:transcription antitermination protein NusB